MDEERERLRDLNTRLMEQHRLLLERERRAYESWHGAVGTQKLFRLLLEAESIAPVTDIAVLAA